MPLRTVRVPEAFAAQFEEAEKLVARYFQLRRDDPEHGTIEIFGERYVLVRAASLSVEFFRLCEELYGPGREVEAAEFARNILFDLAHAIGKSDAHNFHAKMGLVDPIAKLSAGPVHFAFAGWAFVDIAGDSTPALSDDFVLAYDHPYSFEADAWIRAGQRRDFAVCIMNAGYSSGWCEESFGLKLVATELECRARGDGRCHFVMSTPARIEAHVTRLAGEAPVRRGAPPAIPDFFARKRMEDELRRARGELEERVAERTAELARSYEERERVERQLRQARELEGLGRLAGGVAHDFNNLVGIILANAEALDARLDEGDPRRRFVTDIVTTCRGAANLTKQLLAFGKSQSVVRDHVPVLEAVDEAVRMLERLLGDDVELVVARPAEEVWVWADRTQLDQVVINLAINARDAMPGGGRIDIAISAVEIDTTRGAALGVAPGPAVALVVKDQGSGIAPEAMEHLFEPFFTTKEGRGSGMGLSTAYGVVRQSGGAIVASSEPEGGARFEVILPRTEGPSAPSRRGAPSARPGGAETILLVEDQPHLRRIVATILEDSGYRVIAAEDAEDALALAGREGAIDLLLTDVVMPKLRGPALAAKICAARPTIRVLYMSGYAEERTLEGSAGAPAMWLAKPFGADELLTKVRAALGAARAGG